MKIAVLGAGKMGTWFARFFNETGYRVVLADRRPEKLPKLEKDLLVDTTADFVEAVQCADRVLICVSINAFEDVVKKIGPAIREGQIVMDICSVKKSPVDLMHKYIKDGLVLGTHPAFGPGSNGIKNKAFILTPTNSDEQMFAESFKKWLENNEARVFMMSPEHHDELMSVVLGFPHFLGVVACDTLLDQMTYNETKKVAGTTYRVLSTLAEATALETPDLFASLQVSLPQIAAIESTFMERAQDWLNVIRSGDQTAIANKLEQLKSKLTKTSSDYQRSYQTMYQMLESTGT